MEKEDLVQYIRDAIEKGLSRKETTNTLRANGWSLQDIEDAYTRALAHAVAPKASRYGRVALLLLLLVVLLCMLYLMYNSQHFA